jgi:hypothetical protein
MRHLFSPWARHTQAIHCAGAALPDAAPLDDELLRANVMTLLATYFRAGLGDTRFQKRALAAMPADRRDYVSVNLGKIIEMARKLSERSDA